MEGYNSGIEIPKTEYKPSKEEIANMNTDSVTIDTTIQEEIKKGYSLESTSIDFLSSEENIVTHKDTDEVINNITSPQVIDNRDLKNIISAKKVNNSIDYKVQILAGHWIISNKQISNDYNYNGKYSLESHNGWIKYTVGSNSKYSEARDSRNELNNYDFPGPFITAYNYGERISVQEALIITSQNWVP